MSSAKAVSFLAKKSWHTATMRHMEKVWKAEERAKQEERKMAELKQELSEEREMEELRRVHEQLTGQKKKERLDFLYSEPLLNGPSSDDYLLGAKYKSNGEDNDVKNVQSRPGSLWLDQPSLGSESLFDKRTKIREDPLFSIKKEEQHQKALLKNNPVLLNRLRQQLLKKKLKDQEKKEKKEKKRKRKEEKEEKEVSRKRAKLEESNEPNSISESDTNNEKIDKETRSNVEPSIRQERTEKLRRTESERYDKNDGEYDKAERSDRHDRSDRYDRSEKSDRDKSDRDRSDRDRSDRHDGERSYRSDRERSDRYERSDRDRSDRDRSDRKERSDRDRSDKDRSDRNERSDRDRSDGDRNDRDRSDRKERSDRDRSDGDRNDRDRSDRNERSDRDRSGREEDRKERSERRERESDRHSRSDRDKRDPPPQIKKPLTAEEKQKKLEQMLQNAQDINKKREDSINKYITEDKKEQENHLAIDNSEQAPRFLNTMGKEVYSGGSTASLTDRITRNKFYIQKSNLDETGLFRKAPQ